MTSGIEAHKYLPKGEMLGVAFEYHGTTYSVTQKELKRVANLPSAEKTQEMLDWWKGLEK